MNGLAKKKELKLVIENVHHGKVKKKEQLKSRASRRN
jgi:hypothetical protein